MKRNVARHKEVYGPEIKKEIYTLYEERQKEMEDLPLSQEEQSQFQTYNQMMHAAV